MKAQRSERPRAHSDGSLTLARLKQVVAGIKPAGTSANSAAFGRPTTRRGGQAVDAG